MDAVSGALSPVAKYFKPKEVNAEGGVFRLFSQASVGLCLSVAAFCGLTQVYLVAFSLKESSYDKIHQIAVLW